MRDTMATLVSRVRSLIGDPAGAGEAFTDDELEEFLDRWRTDVRNLELELPEHMTTGGVYSFPEAHAPWGDWEDGVELLDLNFNVVTPSTSDLRAGIWTFNPPRDPQAGGHYLLLSKGQTYDVHGAAADALEAWAAKEARAFDVQTQGAKLARSQKLAGLREVAKLMRSQQRPITGRLVRTDEC